MNERPPAFLPRALIAFGWSATFYVGAVLVAFGWSLVPLLLLPDSWPSWVRTGGVALAVIGGVWLLRSLLRVGASLKTAGHALGETEHEALQRLVREVARELDTQPPTKILLTHGVDASAIETRRGLFGRQRVMQLGVGLIATCSVAELRAVIAHELAHFIGGDAWLAPILARVRQNLMRVHEELGASAPLLLYAHVFLRVTQSISREQERWADRAAAGVAGSRALSDALQRQAVNSVLFSLLLRSGVSVLLAGGMRPRNLYDGLRRFASSTDDEGVAKSLRSLVDERQRSPYDSHPPLAERIALLATLQAETVSAVPYDSRAARALLDDAEAVEAQVTQELFESRGHLPLTPIDWDDVASRAVRPVLDEGARSAREHVGRLFGSDRARTDESALRTLLAMLAEPAGANHPSEPPAADAPRSTDAIADTLRRAMQPHVASLLAKTLLRRGGRLIAEVGRPFTVELTGKRHEPDALADDACRDAGAARVLLELLDELPRPEVSQPQIRIPPAALARGEGPKR